jgi:protein-S-isoprenylcysteine O-methyltransferase Ste14
MAKEIDFPPVWLAGFVVCGGLIGLIWPVSFPYSSAIGSFVVALGLVLIVTAVLQMMLVRTTVMPRRESSSLITGGVFRLSRNPIYLGDALLLAGLMMNWDAWLALPLVPLFMRVIHRRFIVEEEARLTRDYGEIYTDYQNTTGRWL